MRNATAKNEEHKRIGKRYRHQKSTHEFYPRRTVRLHRPRRPRQACRQIQEEALPRRPFSLSRRRRRCCKTCARSTLTLHTLVGVVVVGVRSFVKLKDTKSRKERDKKKKKKKEETSALLCSFFFAFFFFFEIFFTHSSNQMSNETGDFYYCMNTRAQFCGVPRASVFGEY